MHRVLKLKNDQLRIIHNVLFANRIDNLRLTAENNLLLKNVIRHQSTNISPSIKTKKVRKKRSKTSKKYAELLVGE